MSDAVFPVMDPLAAPNGHLVRSPYVYGVDPVSGPVDPSRQPPSIEPLQTPRPYQQVLVFSVGCTSSPASMGYEYGPDVESGAREVQVSVSGRSRDVIDPEEHPIGDHDRHLEPGAVSVVVYMHVDGSSGDGSTWEHVNLEPVSVSYAVAYRNMVGPDSRVSDLIVGERSDVAAVTGEGGIRGGKVPVAVPGSSVASDVSRYQGYGRLLPPLSLRGVRSSWARRLRFRC